MLEMTLLLAAGRGDDPGGIGGVFVILGVIAAVVAAGVLGWTLLQRFGRTRPETQERSPDEAGRVGRVSGMRKRASDR